MGRGGSIQVYFFPPATTPAGEYRYKADVCMEWEPIPEECFLYGTIRVIAAAAPTITDVLPSTIRADSQGVLTIVGTNLDGATESSVSISGDGIIRNGFGASAERIVIPYSVDPNATPGVRTIIVGTPSGSTAALLTVELPPVAIELKHEGTVISSDGKFTEDTTIRVTAVNATTGTVLTNFTGTVEIQEDSAVPIYTQNADYGADLPASVTISSGGTTTFVAKSLANPKTRGLNGTPPDPAMIKTNYRTWGGQSLEVRQWIISGNKIDPIATGPVFDWFQYRVKDIFDRASPDLRTVLAKIRTYSLTNAFGNLAQTPGTWGNADSPVQFNPYFRETRIDSVQTGLCGLPDTPRGFTNTVYHEARHAYQFALTAVTNNDEDNDYLVNNVSISPTDLIVDSTASRAVCNPYTGSVLQFVFKGRGNFDDYGDLLNNRPGVSYANEMDAAKFASQH
jgi:hypothetical protein